MNASASATLRSALFAAVIASGCLPGVLAPASAQTAGGAEAARAVVRERNAYAAGGQVRPAGPVSGDWVAAGGKVIVDQAIGGDAMLAGGSVDVRAPVGDDVRAAGADVTIESRVEGELVASGGNITVRPSAAIGRGATLHAGSVSIDGRVEGDLQATARKITIDGEVRGNARLVGEQIELGPKARIGGAVIYVSSSGLKKAEGAVVAGTVTRENPPEPGGRRWEGAAGAPSWVAGAMSFLALLAAGAMFLLLLPRFGVAAAQRVRSSPWLSLGIGFGTIAALPLVAVLLFITLLGIPIGIVLLALYPALWLGGFLVGVLSVSRLLAAALGKEVPAGFRAGIGFFALGLLMTLLVASVPFVGALFAGLLSVAGVGALVLELHGRRTGPGTAAGAGAPTLAPAA